MYIKRDGMIIKDAYLYIPLDENNRHYQEYLEWQANVSHVMSQKAVTDALQALTQRIEALEP